MTKYTIVCPIKINCDGNGWSLFRDAALYSYAKFLNVENVDSFIIICPENEINEIRHECEKFRNIPFKFLSDEMVLDNECQHISGWYKQQLIKLVMCNFVSTSHYLVIDSDMYITRSLNSRDLFHNGRIKYSSEPWQTQNDNNYSTNSNWWKNSCILLGLNFENLINEKYLMGVTPQVLSTIRVKELIEYLLDMYGEEWRKIIYKANFTEFTLYWLFMCMNGYDKNEYTHEGEQLWKHDNNTNVLSWIDENMAANVINNSFQNSSTIFSVIQGYLNLNFIDKLCEQIRTLIDRNTYDVVFIIASMVTPAIIRKFSIEERFTQTLHTIQSIRAKVPNSCCVLVEGSQLTQERKEKLENCVNHLILCDNNKSVRECVMNTRNIGIGECKLLEVGMKFILKNKINAKFCIKLGARYYLSDKFNIANYNPDKYNFRKHFDDVFRFVVYTTGMFSIPMNRISEFIKIIDEMKNKLDWNSMVEKLYYDLIPKEFVHEIETLGLEGRLNYNGDFFSK